MLWQEAALKLAKTVDPVAKQIGAVNTLIRQPDGSFKGYNTDSSAAVGAIERQLVASGKGDLKGKTFLVLGAGGAGKALAVGAQFRGAKVRRRERGEVRAWQPRFGGGGSQAGRARWTAGHG